MEEIDTTDYEKYGGGETVDISLHLPHVIANSM